MGVLARIFQIHEGLQNACRKAFNKADSLTGYFNGISSQTFENGLRAGIHEHQGLKTISLQVKIGAGHADNPADKPGLAHFLEHMTFSQNPETIDRFQNELTARGIHYEAVTGPYETTYSFTAPYSQRNMRLLFNTVFPAIFQPALDPKQVEYEKDVVQAESMMEEDSSRQDLMRSIGRESLDLVFGRRGVELSGLGDSAAIAGFTAEDLQEFHSRYYRPNNCRVEIAAPGGTTGKIFERLKAHLAGLQPAPLPQRSPADLAFEGGARHIDGLNVRQTYCHILFPVPPTSGPRDAAVRDVLHSYLSMATYKEMRGAEDRKNYFNSWRYHDLLGHTFLGFTTNIRPERAHHTLPMVAGLMRDLAEGRIDKGLLAAARSMEKTSLLESSFDRARGKSNMEMPLSAFTANRKMQKNLVAVDEKDLQMLARQALSAPPALVTAGPAGSLHSYEEFKAMLPLPAGKIAANQSVAAIGDGLDGKAVSSIALS